MYTHCDFVKFFPSTNNTESFIWIFKLSVNGISMLTLTNYYKIVLQLQVLNQKFLKHPFFGKCTVKVL